MKEYKRKKEINSLSRIHEKTKMFAKSFKKEKTVLKNLIKTKNDKKIINDTSQKYG